MSQENVEIVRNVYERWNRNADDFALDLFDPQIEIRQTAMIFDTGGTFHGHTGVLRCAEELLSAFGTIDWQPVRWTQRGDWLVVSVNMVAVGAHSEITTEIRVAHSWRLRDGRVTDVYVYASETEALEAAGLSE